MTDSWIDFAISLSIAVTIAAAVILAAIVVSRLLGRHWSPAAALAHAGRVPFRLLVLLVAVWAPVTATMPETPWSGLLDHALRIGAIVVSTWLVCTVALFLEDLGLRRHRIDVPDNRTARRLRTQVLLLRRLTVVLAVLLGGGAVLLTFDGIEALGASVLASAGLVSIVAGLAAQSALANVFAGIQLAFSGAIRIDDVVIVEGEWGRIEEITLSYVVVHVWDDRRMVVPSTYFTTTPFENWTRRNSDLLGSVELDLDWRLDLAELRAELDRILDDTDLWDGRVKVLQVTDAVGGFVRIRILLTARDAPTLFDLRCFVRERMVTALQRSELPPVPRSRVQIVEADAPAGARRDDAAASTLFGNDTSGAERASQFTGPLRTVDPHGGSRSG